jgi:hypothetical protein
MAWFHRLANVFRQKALRSEIDEELRYHLEARADENVAAGMSLEAARGCSQTFWRFYSRPGQGP